MWINQTAYWLKGLQIQITLPWVVENLFLWRHHFLSFIKKNPTIRAQGGELHWLGPANMELINLQNSYIFIS